MLTKALADLERELAAASTPAEKAALGKKSDQLRQQIAAVEKAATEASPTAAPRPLQDKARRRWPRRPRAWAT